MLSVHSAPLSATRTVSHGRTGRCGVVAQPHALPRAGWPRLGFARGDSEQQPVRQSRGFWSVHRHMNQPSLRCSLPSCSVAAPRHTHHHRHHSHHRRHHHRHRRRHHSHRHRHHCNRRRHRRRRGRGRGRG